MRIKLSWFVLIDTSCRLLGPSDPSGLTVPPMACLLFPLWKLHSQNIPQSKTKPQRQQDKQANNKKKLKTFSSSVLWPFSNKIACREPGWNTSLPSGEGSQLNCLVVLSNAVATETVIDVDQRKTPAAQAWACHSHGPQKHKQMAPILDSKGLYGYDLS